MAWWLWIVLGIIVISIEMFVASEFFLFLIGAAGVATGIIVGICSALGMDIAYSTGFFIFAVNSILLILFARGPLKRFFAVKGQKQFSTGTVTITEADIAPNTLGKGNMRGANCQVRNLTDSPLIVGKSYNVSAYDGIILIIK